MRTIEILEKNPLATDAMRKWHHQAVIENASGELPEEFMKELRDMIVGDDIVERIIDANPRNWFDFFDDNNIYIDIKADFDGTFQYALLEGTVSKLGSLEKFKTRKEADTAALEAAIISLENKLILLEKDNKDS
jgi:hypothetical protein